MKTSFRIWLGAILIQPLIFAVQMGIYAAVIIPIEIVGSIPGILIFTFFFNKVMTMRTSLSTKWLLVLLIGFITAALTMLSFLLLFAGIERMLDYDGILLLIPAPIAALISIAINAKAVNKDLKNEPDLPDADPESAIFNNY